MRLHSLNMERMLHRKHVTKYTIFLFFNCSNLETMTWRVDHVVTESQMCQDIMKILKEKKKKFVPNTFQTILY